MKIYFTGSDVLLLNTFPVQLAAEKLAYVEDFRSFIRTAARFVEEWWVVHDHLIPELNKFGITENIKVIVHPIDHGTPYPKIDHKGFNLLYYCPAGEDADWNKWLYGYDVFERVKQYFGDRLNYIELTGEGVMTDIYPITDFYLRCNRHDGGARMVDECKVQGIPYYWSWENPDIVQIINEIETCLR